MDAFAQSRRAVLRSLFKGPASSDSGELHYQQRTSLTQCNLWAGGNVN